MQYFLQVTVSLPCYGATRIQERTKPLGTNTKPTAHKPHMKQNTENKIGYRKCMIEQHKKSKIINYNNHQTSEEQKSKNFFLNKKANVPYKHY